MSTEPTKKKRSDAGKPRSNPAAKLATLAMYVDVAIDILTEIVATSDSSEAAKIANEFNLGQLAALKAVKARLA